MSDYVSVALAVLAVPTLFVAWRQWREVVKRRHVDMYWRIFDAYNSDELRRSRDAFLLSCQKQPRARRLGGSATDHQQKRHSARPIASLRRHTSAACELAIGWNSTGRYGNVDSQTCTLHVRGSNDETTFTTDVTDMESPTLQKLTTSNAVFSPSVSCTSTVDDDIVGAGKIIAVRLD